MSSTVPEPATSVVPEVPTADALRATYDPKLGTTDESPLAALMLQLLSAASGTRLRLDFVQDRAQHTGTAPTSSVQGLDDALAARPAVDAGGRLPTSVLPKLAITDVFTVSSQAAMLGLDAQQGDMAIRTDVGKRFILATSTPWLAASWLQLSSDAAVESVAGRIGAVTLTPADVQGLTTTLNGYGTRLTALEGRGLEGLFEGRTYTEAAFQALAVKPSTYAIVAPGLILGTPTTSATPGDQELNVFTHTIEEGAAHLVVAVSMGVPDGTKNPVFDVRVNGAAMNQLGATAITTGGASNGHNRAAALFALAAPPSGDVEVRVTARSNVGSGAFPSHAATALTVKGASTIGTPVAQVTANTTTATRQVTTDAVGQGVVLAVAAGRYTEPPSAPSAQTTIVRTRAGTNTGHLVTSQPSGAGVVTAASMAAAGQLALLAVPVVPA